MVDNIENKDLTFFTNKNINISVDFFKFLFKNDKLLCIRVLFIINPMILIKYLVKSFIVNLKLIKIKL